MDHAYKILSKEFLHVEPIEINKTTVPMNYIIVGGVVLLGTMLYLSEWHKKEEHYI